MFSVCQPEQINHNTHLGAEAKSKQRISTIPSTRHVHSPVYLGFFRGFFLWTNQSPRRAAARHFPPKENDAITTFEKSSNR